MHCHKWKEILICMYAEKQWNIGGDQHPTKSPIELKDTYNVHQVFSMHLL